MTGAIGGHTKWSVLASLEVDEQSSKTSSDPDETLKPHVSTEASLDTKHRIEEGRRYHSFAENQYWLPNDSTEISRLDIQHICHRIALGSLFLAPLPQHIHTAVDIGTGTGLWPIEFAREYSSVTVIGTDLSAIQDESKAPQNCSFMVANAEEEWDFPGGKMDYIHSRMVLMGIHSWPNYFRRAWENLTPGGWVEVLEPLFPLSYVKDGGVTAESPLFQWSHYMREGALMDGIDTLVAENKFQGWLEEQGFINIHKQGVVWPIGSWAKGEREKLLGNWCHKNMKLFLDGSRGLFTKKLGWSEERFRDLIQAAEKDMDNSNAHYYPQL